MIRSRAPGMRMAAAISALALAAPACAGKDRETAEKIEADITTADGRDAGTVTFQQAKYGVLITVRLKNLTTGTHGFHIHETGSCAPDFNAAGSHYNPGASDHGFHSEKGYHAGDLPNVQIGPDGTAKAEFFVPKLTLGEPEADRLPHTLADADGSAIMIHAQADDHRNMDSSGARVACGVIIAASSRSLLP